MKIIIFIACFVFQLITLEATPPGDPQLFPLVKGKIEYAVWRGPHSVKELRVNENGISGEAPENISKKATWYVVISGVENISKFDKDTISVSISLDRLFPKIPDMNAFPPGSMLIEFEGNSDLPVELGKILELKNVKFQMFEYGGVFKVDKIKLLPKPVASKG